MRHARGGGGGRRVGLLVAAVVAAAVALVGGIAGCSGPATDTPATATSTSAPAPAPSSVLAAPPHAVAPLGRSTPTRVSVPAIGVDTDLVPLGLNPDNTVEVPPLAHPEEAGWYRYAPTPGAVGPAVILGHIDGDGQKGVFYRLQSMAPGQQITVTRADGRAAIFTVTEVDRFPKNTFPTQRVYGETPDAQLRLISCGGALDRAAHSYLDNVVVFATLTGSAKA